MRWPILILAACIAGCSSVEMNDDALIAEARTAIANDLADPKSARFDQLKVPSAGEIRVNGVVCGMVSGRFKDGVQDTPRRFLYAKLAGFAGVEDKPLSGEDVLPEAAEYQVQFDELWREFCQAP
jgi:hypothetical protein